jgi:surfeit locus 1 family protein
VRRHAGRLLQLGQAAPLKPGAIVQNLDAGELAQASGLEIEPFIVEQTSDSNDGLVRAWPLPSQGIDRHLGYAFQWFALAATAFLFFVVTGFKRAST